MRACVHRGECVCMRVAAFVLYFSKKKFGDFCIRFPIFTLLGIVDFNHAFFRDPWGSLCSSKKKRKLTFNFHLEGCKRLSYKIH